MADKKHTAKKRQATGGKTTARKTARASKKTAKRAAKKATAKTARKSSAKAGQVSEKVTIPTNMSKRAVEKSGVLRSDLDEYVRRSMYAISYVAGLCFVLVGGAYAGSQMIAPDTAELMRGEVITSDNQDTNTTNSTSTTQDPELVWTTDIPPTISEPKEVTFNLKHVAGQQAVLKTAAGESVAGLQMKQIGTDAYSVVIPVGADTLTYDEYYRIRVLATPLDHGEVVNYDSTKFQVVSGTVPPPEFAWVTDIPEQLEEPLEVEFELTNITDELKASLRTESGSWIPLTTKPIAGDNYRALIPTDQLSDGQYTLFVHARGLDGNPVSYDAGPFTVGPVETTVDSNNDATTTSEEEVTQTQTEDKTDDQTTVERAQEEKAAPTTENQSFYLIPPADTTVSDYARINVRVPEGYAFAELYARPIHSLDSHFVSLATERYGQTVFIVNSKNLKNGEYEFYARAKVGEEIIESDPLVLTVQNEQVRAADNENVTITAGGSSDDEPRELETVDRYITASTALSDAVDEEVYELLREHRAEFNDLLKRYAVAQQSGDPIMIDAAREALDEKQKELVTFALQNERLRDIADNIDERLTERVQELQQRVDTFENIRRDRSGGATAADTDGDGVSDLDEQQLYGTDPTAADSDNDGVNDGIEIVRGYDPNDATSEAVIAYESPKETVGLERDDVLKIDSVTPVQSAPTATTSTASDTSTTATAPERPASPDTKIASSAPIKTEIRGSALPNSFVTLYIYSTPTVVTVRTDADGSFVYTFDQELADGRHDVYVAVTDNAGEILAQSRPFSFVKEAQAYEPVGAETAGSVTAATERPGANESAYNVVIGIGVLAFGIILIMLGISLRSKEDDDDDGGHGDSNRAGTSEPAGSNAMTNQPKTEARTVRGEHIDAT